MWDAIVMTVFGAD